jgi:hypothetical protein
MQIRKGSQDYGTILWIWALDRAVGDFRGRVSVMQCGVVVRTVVPVVGHHNGRESTVCAYDHVSGLPPSARASRLHT